MAWLQTRDGRAMDLDVPSPRAITLDEIAWSLAHLCRFVGQVRRGHYSVAEHAVHASYIVEESALDHSRRNNLPDDTWEGKTLLWLRQCALMHDAPEAWIGDIPAPLKWHIERRAPAVIRNLEQSLLDAVSMALGLPIEVNGIVKRADLVMLASEKAALMAEPPRPWVELPPPSAEAIGRIECWERLEAYERFLQRAEELGIREVGG